MNHKRGYADSSCYQRPPFKRNRYLDHNQPQPPHHHHQQQQYQYQYQHQHTHRNDYSRYSRDNHPSYDPIHCIDHFERLSLSRENPPIWKRHIPDIKSTNSAGTLNPSQVTSDKPRYTYTSSANSAKYADSIAPHLKNTSSNSNSQPTSLSSSQNQSGWTQVVRKGMQDKENHSQPVSKSWADALPPPPLPPTQPLVREPPRSIAKLPQRAPLISPNIFSVLTSHSSNEGSSPNRPVLSYADLNSTESTPNTTKVGRKKTRKSKKSKKKGKQAVPIIIDDDKKIDIVLDTNILLSFQHFLRGVIPLLSSTCRILVPQAVVMELDMQKNRQQPVEVYEAGRFSSKTAMGCLARQATNWLLSVTKSNHSNVLIQKMEEESEEMKKGKDADSRILSYAHSLFLLAKSQKSGAVIALLSNDNILRLRARSEGICCMSMSDVQHSPRQMMCNIRNFVPLVSTSNAPAPTDTSSRCPILPTKEPTVAKSKLTTKRKDPPQTSSIPSSQFTFTSLLPNINRPMDSIAPAGPDRELDRLKSHLNKPRTCKGCQSEVQSTLQVSPDKIHHYCPMCCEIICRGCMRETGCDWDCPGPFNGKVCATMACCAEGRAGILLELLGQLDSYSLTNHYKVSFKEGSKITHRHGDEALTQYLQATATLLAISKEEDERVGFLESVLLSSTLLDVLSQTLLSSPFLKWHLRSEVFISAIKLVKIILQSLTRPWAIINSEYSKISTTGILSASHGHQKITWKRIIETSLQSNATAIKVDKLRETFPTLISDVADVLRNLPGSSSTIIQKLLDHSVQVPLCYILENLFQWCMKAPPPPPPSNKTEDIDGPHCELARLREELVELKKVYDTKITTRTPDSSNTQPMNSIKDSEIRLEDVDVEARAEARPRENVNHEVNIYLEGGAGEGSEVEVISSRKENISPSQQVKNRVKDKLVKSKDTEAVGKCSKPTSSVKKCYSISSDESAGSDSDDCSIEVITLH